MLQIIDRKKDLVKLQMGEYVALSKVRIRCGSGAEVRVAGSGKAWKREEVAAPGPLRGSAAPRPLLHPRYLHILARFSSPPFSAYAHPPPLRPCCASRNPQVENAMKLSPYVEQCMAYALPTKSHVVAVVVPSEKALRPFADGKGLAGKTFAQLARRRNTHLHDAMIFISSTPR